MGPGQTCEPTGALGTAASLAGVALGGALLGHPAAKPADGSPAAALGTTWHQCRGPGAPAARLWCAAAPPASPASPGGGKGRPGWAEPPALRPCVALGLKTHGSSFMEERHFFRSLFKGLSGFGW